jgi:putative YphP/YqiW family bacilliredoxin
MALFKNGELVQRHHIEGRPAEMIAENLQDALTSTVKTTLSK